MQYSIIITIITCDGDKCLLQYRLQFLYYVLLGAFVPWGFWPPNGILPGAKFTLRPSLAFSYNSSVTAQHSSSQRQPNFAAWCREWNYRTFAPRHF